MSDEKAVRSAAKRISREQLGFNSEHLKEAENYYVAWLDMMGAGHIMSTSVQKSANILVRLHMSVEIAISASGYQMRTLPINDGIFIVSSRKGELMTIVQHVMALLALRFAATPRPHDRCLMRGGIAFGPVYEGSKLTPGISLKKLKTNATFLARVLFGPPIIQAYKSEGFAPPYGIAVHESARAFANTGDRPFQMTHWLWWLSHPESTMAKGLPPLKDIRECLWADLQKHFKWLNNTLLLHGLKREKVIEWEAMSKQYFAAGEGLD